MMLKRIVTPNVFHKVKQLESLAKTNLFANSCKPLQLGRTSATLANIKLCSNSSVINSNTKYCMTKFPITAAVGTQLNRKASNISGDHVRIWVLEKLASVAIPIVIPLAFITEHAYLDGIMSILVVMHTYWGLEAIVTDYARPIIMGHILPKVLHVILFMVSAATLCGLFVLINDGPGVAKAVKNLWAIKPKQDTVTVK